MYSNELFKEFKIITVHQLYLRSVADQEMSFGGRGGANRLGVWNISHLEGDSGLSPKSLLEFRGENSNFRPPM
jgi:hypothetical protein